MPIEALRYAVRTWLDICVEPEIHRIALIDGPSHALMGAGDEAALYVAEADDHAQARAEMIGVLDQLIAGVTA